MSRCFSNDNIEPIKNSKEYTEMKRNDALFCNYTNNYWTKNGIFIPRDKKYEKRIDNYGKFQVNNKNKIEKANNHENYLRLSKGMFQRTVMMSKYALEREKWSKRKELNKLKQQNLFPLKKIDAENLKYDLSNNRSDYMYFSGSVFDGDDLSYLNTKNALLNKSIFSVKTSDITVDDMLGKKINYTPTCFSLHNTKYNLEVKQETLREFFTGYLLCGNFDKTTEDPFKSGEKYTLTSSNKNVSDEMNWSFVENSYNWGFTTAKWTSNEYLSLNVGNLQPVGWILSFDFKFSFFQKQGEALTVGRKNNDNPNIILVKTNQANNNVASQGIQIENDNFKVAGIPYDTFEDGTDADLKRGVWYNIIFAFGRQAVIMLNGKNLVPKDGITPINPEGLILNNKIDFFRDTTVGETGGNKEYNIDSGYIKNIFLFGNITRNINLDMLYKTIKNYTAIDS